MIALLSWQTEACKTAQANLDVRSCHCFGRRMLLQCSQRSDLHHTCYGARVLAAMKQQMAVQETNKEAGVLVKAEERAKGRVDRRLYRTYLSAWGPFFAIPLLMVVLATSERGLQVSQGLSERLLNEMILCIQHCLSPLPAPNAGLSTQHSSQCVSVEKG